MGDGDDACDEEWEDEQKKKTEDESKIATATMMVPLLQRAANKYIGQNTNEEGTEVHEQQKAKQRLFQAKGKGQSEIYNKWNGDAAPPPLLAMRQ